MVQDWTVLRDLCVLCVEKLRRHFRLAGGDGGRLNRLAVIFRRLIVRLLLLAAFACAPLLWAAESIADLRAKAEKGDAETQFTLGVMYHRGDGVPKDVSEAVNWYRKAAERGYAYAQYNLGVMYADGEGVQRNSTEATKWYRKAADQGVAAAQSELGRAYGIGDGVPIDHFEAVKWYRKAADQNDATAQRELGLAHANGESVTKDLVEALKWLRKAADQGDTGAQYSLGTMYRLGKGVAKDDAEAEKWIQKAAEQGDYDASIYKRAENGNANAQWWLGNSFEYGLGVPQDDIESIKWFRKAAEQGDADHQLSLGKQYATGDHVPQDSAEAAKWFGKAAAQGKGEAQYQLARAYAKGEGVTKDSSEAMKWLQKAASGYVYASIDLAAFNADRNNGIPLDAADAIERLRKLASMGNAEAQDALGMAFEFGYGVKGSDVEAASWYRKSASQDFQHAQVRLAFLYYNRKELRDYAEAAKWFRAAAYLGNIGGQRMLSLMFKIGEGVPKNEIEALAWSYVLAATGDDQAKKSVSQDEDRLGPNVALLAQERSKAIFQEIDLAKAKTAAAKPSSNEPFITDNPKASGTGALVTAQGHVLTAAHVVAGATSIKVATAQGMKSATVLRVDEANDLAVLKISEGKFKALAVAASRQIKLGQTVATIGFPNVDIQGFSPKVTKGEISSLNGVGDDPRSWQISAPVQPGNSGGPLLDESGNLIGIVVSKLGLKAAQATGDIPQNVNYAVKSAYALALLEPYLDSNAPVPSIATAKPKFEDMVAKAQDSVVLILVY